MKNNKKLQIITTTSLVFTMTTAMALKPTFVLADEGMATAGQFTAGEIEEGEGTIAAPEQPTDPVSPEEIPAEPTPAVPTPTPEPETPVAPSPTPEPEAPVTPANPSQPTEETPAPHQGNNEATGFTINYVDENGNHIYDSIHSTEAASNNKATKHAEIETGVRGNLLLSFVTTIASLLTAGYLLVKNSKKQ